MASRKRSLSEFRDAAGAVQSSFVDDTRYRQSVLQLEPDQTEDSINAALVDEARQLGFASWDAHVSESYERSFSDFFESTGTRTPPHTGTSSSASVRQPSTANTSAVQIPESAKTTTTTVTAASSASYKDRIPLSRHSVVSSSTCPPLCSCNHEKPPSLSSMRAENAPSTNNRYSLDPRRQSISNRSFYSSSTASSRRPESSDSRLRSGLKHAFLHFPPFKKRASVDSTTALSRSLTCPDCQNQNLPAPDVEYRKSSAPDVGVREWMSPVKHPLRPADEDAVFRSLACPALLTMRSSQQDQKNRFLALRRDVVEQMATAHRDLLENRRSQNLQAEQDLADRVSRGPEIGHV